MYRTQKNGVPNPALLFGRLSPPLIKHLCIKSIHYTVYYSPSIVRTGVSFTFFSSLSWHKLYLLCGVPQPPFFPKKDKFKDSHTIIYYIMAFFILFPTTLWWPPRVGLLGMHYFQKNATFLRSFEKKATFSHSFAFFIKRMLCSLHSFTFFIKECCVLCILLCSL